MAAKRVHYEAAMKRKVILYADKHGNRAASREFQVSEVNVRRWRNDRDSIFSCEATSKCFTGPKTGRFPEIDEAVICFVRENRAKGLPVTLQAMQLKAEEIADSLGIPEEIFKGSRGWCEGLMRRAGLSLRQRGSPAGAKKKLPTDFRQKLIDFQQRVTELRNKKNYAVNHIGNVEETELVFDTPSADAVDAKSCAGSEKQRVTVMLCVTADGRKLPLYLILHRKSVPNGEVFPGDLVVRAQKNGRMSAELMEDWLNAVWNSHVLSAGLPHPPHMLVLDENLSEQVKNGSALNGGDLVAVPSGMGSQLQPLRVAVVELFKEFVRKEHESWLMSADLPLTPAGKMKKAPASKLAEWVSTAWKLIPQTLVQQAFKKCCITNALDEADDPMTWSDKDGSEQSETDSESSDE